MTDRTRRTLILVVVLCIAISTILIGCSGKELDAPELVFDSVRGIVNWDAVSDAKNYKVVYKDKTAIVEEPHFVLKERGKYDVTVTAIAGDKKHSNSKPSTIEVLYSTIIETPKVRFSPYYGGNIRYIIDNYDEFAKGYDIIVNGNKHNVTTNRGVIETNLADGKYTVSMQAKGDGIITRDSEVVSKEVIIKPIERYTAEYEVKVGGTDFSFELAKSKPILSIFVDFFEIESSNYNNPALNGGILTIKDSIFVNHVGDEPARVEVNFNDGDIILIEVTIIDNRQADFGDIEYVSVYTGYDAYIDFEIFRNELVSIELKKADGTMRLLDAKADYNITYNMLRASLVVFKPVAEEDSALVFTFKKGDNTYTREIKYYFQEVAPNVTTHHFTYNKGYATRSDILVKYVGSNNKVTDVRFDFAVSDTDYSIDEKLGQVLIKRSYLDQLPSGSIVTGRLYFGSEYDTFTVHVIDIADYQVASFSSDEYVHLTHANSIDLEMPVVGDFNMSALSIDSIKVDKNYYSVVGNGSNKSIVISSRLLNSLDAGIHEVRAHLRGDITYDIVANVLVGAKNLQPTNIVESVDNVYPYLAISYQPVSDDTSTYVTNLRTDKKYYNKYGESRVLVPYSDMKDGDKYTVTHTRDSEVVTSAQIEYKEKNVKNYEQYYTANFTWGGDTYDAVITSDEEFETLLHYALMSVSKMRAYGMNTDPNDTMMWSKANRAQYEYTVKIFTPYISYDKETYIGIISSLINRYIGNRSHQGTYKEPTKIEYHILSDKYNECSLSLRVNSTNVPYVASEKGHEVTPTRYKLGLERQNKTAKPRSIGFDDFKINKWKKTQRVYLADEIYYAIEDGARPIPIEGSPAETMLEIIKDVMREICDDSMSDTEKYRAIFDWIVHNVTYDHATAEYESHLSSSQYSKIYPRRCFYLDGVFIDKVAVCNGLAKAVVVMAGLEGINSMKVVGGSANGRHAWVKARLDGVWYNSDPTWGTTTLSGEPTIEGKTAEGINHSYTLVSDGPFNKNNAHREDSRFGVVVANIDYDYFANMHMSKGANGVNTAVITTKDDAIALARANVELAQAKPKIAIAYLNNAMSAAFSPMSVMADELTRLTGKTWSVAFRPETISSKHIYKTYTLVTFVRA